MEPTADKKVVHHQDKPIRPRYGLPEVESIEVDINSCSSIPKVCKRLDDEEDNAEVASSYSEIPFAALLQGNPSCRPISTADEATTTTTTISNAELLDNEHDIENELVNDADEDLDEDEDNNDTPLNVDGNDHYFYTAHKSYGLTIMARHQQQQQQQQQLPQIDADVLNDIEIDAQYLAASVDNLLENLCSLLHSISSIAADNVEVHRNAVNRMTDSMDTNIKCMYTIMAKTEEITKSMKPTEHLAQRIREIKRLVDMLESTM